MNRGRSPGGNYRGESSEVKSPVEINGAEITGGNHRGEITGEFTCFGRDMYCMCIGLVYHMLTCNENVGSYMWHCGCDRLLFPIHNDKSMMAF